MVNIMAFQSEDRGFASCRHRTAFSPDNTSLAAVSFLKMIYIVVLFVKEVKGKICPSSTVCAPKEEMSVGKSDGSF